MKIKITKFIPPENKSNEVLSEKLFKPRRFKDKNGEWRFHEEGIFSREIFGHVMRCNCGANRKVGTWCEHCGTRVVSVHNMPDFYISTDISVPFINTDFTVFGKNGPAIESVLKYESFVYDGEVVEFDLETIDLEAYSDYDKVLVGHEAAKFLGATEEWLKENTLDKVPISHPIYRSLIETKQGKYIIGEVNQILVDLIDSKIKYKSFHTSDVFASMGVSRLLATKYYDVVKAMFETQISNRRNIIKQEAIGQSITGAIRAVIVNNFSLDEDVILIGQELVETLWPHLYKDFGGDMYKINEELKKENYLVIVNRPPTIGEKSVIAMRPEISFDEDRRFVIGTNPIIFDGLAADTDGDVFLVVALYSKDATKEAMKILPSQNYIGGSNGKIRNGMPEDFIFAMKQIYKYDEDLKNKIKSIIYKGGPK